MQLLDQLTFGGLQRQIASLREKKGREKEALGFIAKAINFSQGVVVNLWWERALVYQHMVMTEDSKKKGNIKRRNSALAKMETAVLVAGKYIRENNLKEWESRYHRFLGRINDYRGDFEESVRAYKKALLQARLDPEYIQKGYPRWLEIDAFLSYALIMSGRGKRGFSLAKKTYDKFDSSPDAKALKEKDYFTWAVWKSGIPIRTINAFLASKFSFNKKEMVSWLSEAEETLHPPKNVKIWGDLGLRKDELEAVKNRLTQTLT